VSIDCVEISEPEPTIVLSPIGEVTNIAVGCNSAEPIIFLVPIPAIDADV